MIIRRDNMNSYDKEIVFHLPGAFERSYVYLGLFNLADKHPEYFKDNAFVGSVYGAPGGIWNGGRLLQNKQASKEELEKLENMYRFFEIPVRFTYTNPLIVGNFVYDAYCNMVLDVFNNGNNEIICNSQDLEDYLRDKYGDSYKYISSTTKRLKDKDEQTKELEKDYYLVVIDYDHNFDMEYLNSIEDKEKCEILVNPVCIPKCPKRSEHYANTGECQLYNIDKPMECPFSSIKTYYLVKKQENYISPQMINDIYIPAGFKHFKIEGRTTNPLDLIEILLDYLVKEEYHLDARQQLHESFFNQFF